MKKLLIENLSENLTLLQKVDFEAVDAVFDALDFAFHPNGLAKEDEPDDRFLAFWKLFLISAGWSENDYWMEAEFRSENCTCGKCHIENNDVIKTDKDSN